MCPPIQMVGKRVQGYVPLFKNSSHRTPPYLNRLYSFFQCFSCPCALWSCNWFLINFFSYSYCFRCRRYILLNSCWLIQHSVSTSTKHNKLHDFCTLLGPNFKRLQHSYVGPTGSTLLTFLNSNHEYRKSARVRIIC